MCAQASPDAETIRIDDGRTFVLRPLAVGDLDALHRAFRRLTAEEIQFRFLQYTSELPAFVVAQVGSLDPALDAAFVIDDDGEIRAVADLHLDRPGAREAEFGLIVGKAVSGHGLGTRLMRRLLQEAARRGLTLLHGLVRADNARMLQLCRELGAAIHPTAEGPGLRSVRFVP